MSDSTINEGKVTSVVRALRRAAWLEVPQSAHNDLRSLAIILVHLVQTYNNTPLAPVVNELVERLYWYSDNTGCVVGMSLTDDSQTPQLTVVKSPTGPDANRIIALKLLSATYRGLASYNERMEVGQ